MPKPVSCFVGLVALCVATQANARPATADEHAQFTAIENEWLTDIVRHDGYALFRLLAQDFAHVSWNGTVEDKKDAIDSALKTPARQKHLGDMTVNLFNDTTAIVAGETRMGDGDGEVSVRFTDVFVRRDGLWQAVSAQETLIQAP
jgi:hypothetical protein